MASAPTAGHLTVQHPAGESLELELADLSGKIVLHRRLEFTTERINLDIPTALPGMYLLTMRHAKSGRAIQVKVVKTGW